MTVKRKALEAAANELNFFLDPNPPINIKEKSDALKQKVIEAGNLLEDGEQELSLSTTTGLEGEELKARKTKIAGIQNTLKELGVKLFGGKTVKTTEQEVTEAPITENTDAQTTLIDMIQAAKKLVDLKAIVEAEDVFESLREKLDAYTGLHGIGLLRIELLERLKGTTTAPTSEGHEKHGNDKSILQTAIIHLEGKDNPKKKGSKSFDRFELYKDGMSVQQYIKAGGHRADIKWDVDHGFISTNV